jgi:hypothetical protein
MTPTDDEILAVLLTWRARTSGFTNIVAPDRAALKALRGLFARGNDEVRAERLETARLLLAGYRASGDGSPVGWAVQDADELIAAIDAKGTADET